MALLFALRGLLPRITVPNYYYAILAVVLIFGFVPCSTVQYKAERRTKDQDAAELKINPVLVLRPLRHSEGIVVGGIAISDAAASLKRIIMYGDVTNAGTAQISSESRYTEILKRSIARWSPTLTQVKNLRHLESVLLRQPNALQCFGILFCKKSFARESSVQLRRYYDLRARVAEVQDGLSACEKKLLPCVAERNTLESVRNTWNNSADRRMVERALDQHQELISKDPELQKISALDRLSRFRGATGVPSSDDPAQVLKWTLNRVPPKNIKGLPSGVAMPHTFFVEVQQNWFDKSLIESNVIVIPANQMQYIFDAPLFIPAFLVLVESINENGKSDIAVSGILGMEVYAERNEKNKIFRSTNLPN